MAEKRAWDGGLPKDLIGQFYKARLSVQSLILLRAALRAHVLNAEDAKLFVAGTRAARAMQAWLAFPEDEALFDSADAAIANADGFGAHRLALAWRGMQGDVPAALQGLVDDWPIGDGLGLSELWAHVRADLKTAGSGRTALYRSPLIRPDRRQEDALVLELWRRAKVWLEETAGEHDAVVPWEIWFEQVLLHGAPDAELDRLISLIDESVWTAGREPASQAIAARTAQREVLRQAEAARAVLDRLDREEIQSALIGHNQGPPLDDTALGRDARAELEAALETLAGQSRQRNPDPLAVAQAKEKVDGFLHRAAAWMGRKLDQTLDEFLKTLGKAGGVAVGGAVGALVLDLFDALQPLKEAVAAWLQLL